MLEEILEHKGAIALFIFALILGIWMITWAYGRSNQVKSRSKKTKPKGWANFEKFLRNKSLLISPEIALRGLLLDNYKAFASGLRTTLRGFKAQNIDIKEEPASQSAVDLQIIINPVVNDEGYVFLVSYKPWRCQKTTQTKVVLDGMSDLKGFQTKRMTIDEFQTRFPVFLQTVLNPNR